MWILNPLDTLGPWIFVGFMDRKGIWKRKDEQKNEVEKLNLFVWFHYHFLFNWAISPQILDPNTALKNRNAVSYFMDFSLYEMTFSWYFIYGSYYQQLHIRTLRSGNQCPQSGQMRSTVCTSSPWKHLSWTICIIHLVHLAFDQKTSIQPIQKSVLSVQMVVSPLARLDT